MAAFCATICVGSDCGNQASIRSRYEGCLVVVHGGRWRWHRNAYIEERLPPTFVYMVLTNFSNLTSKPYLSIVATCTLSQSRHDFTHRRDEPGVCSMSSERVDDSVDGISGKIQKSDVPVAA